MESLDRFLSNFQKYIKPIINVEEPISFLEIGVYRGTTAKWVLENVLTHDDSRYYGIEINPTLIDQSVINNNKAQILNYSSFQILLNININKHNWPSFNIIYIDCVHSALPVLQDSILSWNILNENGIIVWDDYFYGWIDGVGGLPAQPVENRSKEAIDAFLNSVSSKHMLLFVNDNQIGIKKLCH